MANAKGNRKAVEVDGRKYTVDKSRLESWTAAKMIAAISSAESESESAAYAIKLLDYVLGDEMDKVVKACGGADAPAEKVINLGYEIIGAASKN